VDAPSHDPAADVSVQEDILGHLARRGLIPAAEGRVAPLGGGVSGDVFAVDAAGLRLVVKRPLARLRVEAEWLADDVRIVTEARALRLAGDVTPGVVPRVVDLDAEQRVLVMEAAPAGWRNWRDELLAGRVDTSVARRLGEALSRWHAATAAAPDVRDRFPSNDVFVQLRIDPFHRTVAGRHPDLAAAIEQVADGLLRSRTCLVHGDFSPKNVLVGADGAWVLDWEVAHVGDPVFDVAFLCAHLVLKSVHRPADAGRYRDAMLDFLAAYGPVDDAALVANTGCLLLARVDGKSPAAYLSDAERASVSQLAARMLREPPARLSDIVPPSP
jgi:5-methylthioribose kinase